MSDRWHPVGESAFAGREELSLRRAAPNSDWERPTAVVDRFPSRLAARATVGHGPGSARIRLSWGRRRLTSAPTSGGLAEEPVGGAGWSAAGGRTGSLPSGSAT